MLDRRAQTLGPAHGRGFVRESGVLLTPSCAACAPTRLQRGRDRVEKARRAPERRQPRRSRRRPAHGAGESRRFCYSAFAVVMQRASSAWTLHAPGVNDLSDDELLADTIGCGVLDVLDGLPHDAEARRATWKASCAWLSARSARVHAIGAGSPDGRKDAPRYQSNQRLMRPAKADSVVSGFREGAARGSLSNRRPSARRPYASQRGRAALPPRANLGRVPLPVLSATAGQNTH